MRSAAAAIVLLLMLGCAGAGAEPQPQLPFPLLPPTPTKPPPQRSVAAWVDATRSPWPATTTTSTGDAREAALTAACGTADGALARVAKKLVNERVQGHGKPDPDDVVALLREYGEPHTRPRVLTASSSGQEPLDDQSLRAQLSTSLKRDASTTTRCAVALGRTEQGKEMLVGIAVDALADLEALPTRARTGEWLTLAASLRVPATNARVVVLGPRGLPRTVPTSIDPNGRARARFALDRPGAFTVQLVGDLVKGGPQPLLEARVFADVEPFTAEAIPAPGEEKEKTTNNGDDVDVEVGGVAALVRMTTALRVSESLPPLIRDERLDALAKTHAKKMQESGTIAHDLGDGDLAVRFESAALAASVVGENVARARSVALAYRALHSSPSHRMNLLHAQYTHVGQAVVSDRDVVYVCQVFAALR